MYPILATIILLLTGNAWQVALTPPPPPPEEDADIGFVEQLLEYGIYPLAFYIRLLASALAGCHAATILLLGYAPPDAASQLLPYICAAEHPSLRLLSAPTPRFILGIALLGTGALVRLACVFAAEADSPHTAKDADDGTHGAPDDIPDERLLTHGPYAYVRHPTHTAVWAMLAGAGVMWTAPEAYLRECAVMHTSAGFLVQAWAVAAVCVAVGLYRRTPSEEAARKEQFGGKWEAYVRRVPYKFVPYVM
ncbi:hypothetical protein PsYK624_114140 [Phanerochaete sordida]|uniref:Protein-S-isoprenylcysteine O-methyltransferase n=1 Tax=Phanerochaete sordida TaxID=48140 RepID=A0A9P3LIJ6_9APHY|nr:hypothetical protein PsYK624_114140 [Phanerochaete sordida]